MSERKRERGNVILILKLNCEDRRGQFLFPGWSHRTDVVHQLFVLHEAAATEVTGPRAPGHRGRVGGAVVDQGGGGGPGVGYEGGQEGSPHQGEGRTTEELLCKIE